MQYAYWLKVYFLANEFNITLLDDMMKKIRANQYEIINAE